MQVNRRTFAGLMMAGAAFLPSFHIEAQSDGPVPEVEPVFDVIVAQTAQC